MFERELSLPSKFVGRRSSMDWFERIIFSHEHWHRPYFVVGPGGIGKTTAVKYFMVRHGAAKDPLWINLREVKNIDDVLMEFDSRIRSRRGSSERDANGIVVLDGADEQKDDHVEVLFNRISNYKAVRAVIITSRHVPEFHIPKEMQGPVLKLAGLSKAEARELLESELKVSVPPETKMQLIARAEGHPLALKLMSGAVNTGGLASINELLSGLKYDITESYPDAKLIEVAKP